METARSTVLSLVPEVLATIYRILPLRYDTGVLYAAVTADYASYIDNLKTFLGLQQIEVEVWTEEEILRGISQAYGDPNTNLIAEQPSRLREVLDIVQCIGCVIICHILARRIRSHCSLEVANTYRCLCGQRLAIRFDPTGREFTIHCPSFRHGFPDFAIASPPKWWRERISYDWLD